MTTVDAGDGPLPALLRHWQARCCQRGLADVAGAWDTQAGSGLVDEVLLISVEADRDDCSGHTRRVYRVLPISRHQPQLGSVPSARCITVSLTGWQRTRPWPSVRCIA